MLLEIYAKKLISDNYVLFVVTATDQKSPHQLYAGYPKKHSYQVSFQLVKKCHRRFLKEITLKIANTVEKGQ